jgi:hypothetical protein
LDIGTDEFPRSLRPDGAHTKAVAQATDNQSGKTQRPDTERRGLSCKWVLPLVLLVAIALAV